MLAIIPARGGSKQLKKKNLRLINNKPLIFYTIEAAKLSKKIKRIVLSTDDEEIANVCKSFDVEIPFMRPKKLATDDSLIIDSYIYTLEKLQKEYNYKDENFVSLLPTSPLRNSEDIDQAIELFYEKKADSVISCTELDHPYLWTVRINENKKMKFQNISNYHKMSNRQGTEIFYRPNGAIYVMNYAFIVKNKKHFSDNTYAYLMPKERSIDIDSEFDLKIAKLLINK